MEEKKSRFCSNCGAKIDAKARICPRCGVEQSLPLRRVSNWWYLPAVFLGVIGGFIAWAVNRDQNPKKAIHFLIAGLILPVIYVMGFLVLIVLVSLTGARERGKDSIIANDMGQIQAIAEEIHLAEGNYSKLNYLNPEIASLYQDIRNQTEEKLIIYSTQQAYCTYIKLFSGDYYCLDSHGRLGAGETYPGKTGYCDGETFICP